MSKLLVVIMMLIVPIFSWAGVKKPIYDTSHKYIVFFEATDELEKRIVGCIDVDYHKIQSTKDMVNIIKFIKDKNNELDNISITGFESIK